MSQTHRARQSSSNRSRRKAAEAAARSRRRWGIGATGVAALVVAGAILALHFASQPTRSASATASATGPVVGHVAPNGAFNTLAGTTASIASLRGHPTLVWLVTTWCTSCQAGTQLLAQNIGKLQADGVRVEEIELYQDLGQAGPSIGSFATTYAGAKATSPDWSWGISSAALTRTYDPQSDLEIYYLLNAKGQVTYVDAPLVSTMPQLLQAAGRLR